MSWIDAVPSAMVAVAWLLLPGLPITYALGLRGVAAAAMAAVASVAIVPATAIAAGMVGIRWSAGPPIVVCVAAAVVIAAGIFLLRRRFQAVREPDPRGVTIAAAAGLLPALALGVATLVRGFGRPDNISQTYDALFHYNAIALILDNGNGSSMILSNFDSPGAPASFYPGAWHDFASLVVLTTGSSIPVAANVLAAVTAIVLWPLGCVFLARQVFGRSPAALAITGVLSVGFTAGPWGLLGFGVLWPNALGMAIVPMGLAVILSAVGLAKDDPIGRWRAIVLLPLTAVAAALAHPGALFSLVALGIFPLGHFVISRALRLWRDGRWPRAAGEVVSVLVVLGATWYWTATTPNPAFRNVREMHWPPFETPSRAVGEVLLNATNGWNGLWLLSAAVVVGLVTSLKVVEQRWLIPAHLCSGFLYVVAATINRPETRKFTGYWYNDSFRLAAMLPVTGVPLAVAGILWLTGKILARVPAPEAGESRAPAWLRRKPGTAAGIAIGLAAILAVGTNGMYLPERTERLTFPYLKHSGGDTLASRDEQIFLTRVRELIPPEAVTANNPWDGSGLLWALGDRRTLFPHFSASVSADQRYLAEHLADAAEDPQVCTIANRLHVEYLMIGDSRFWPWDLRRNDYPGLSDPLDRRGFQLVAAEGARKLYRITACAANQQSSRASFGTRGNG